MSQKMIKMKTFKKCGKEIENSLRSRCIEPCSTENYINSLEDILTRTNIDRAWKKLEMKSQNKPFIKEDKTKEPFKPNNTNVQRKFHKCDSIGHLENNLLKKGKIKEILEAQGQNAKEEEFDSEKESDKEKTSEIDEIKIVLQYMKYIM
ncbi:hypothetical protein O181_068409 [Austropuccinia psidii MF-1]|uniref:Uncharacterized protein n=1 Tax=Austropuccinia psidii MF-1 TaxID=1389203 RepID=A0A9Q3EX86_9BASI|nr:hypothetical protein [Austropuccinia psidii MF-1]